MRIFTDPHIGRRAGAHTSHESSTWLDSAIHSNALTASATNDTVVCVGDLFDKSHNKEVDLLKGLEVAEQCDLILAGNHDLSNRDNTKTSIEVVEEVHSNLCRAKVNEVLIDHHEDDEGVTFSIIPHHSSQDLFDQAIKKACENPIGGDLGKQDIIFLHCNFNNPFAQNDASLNLSTEQAAALLECYKYIVMGHEHNHRWEMGGRLLICGNTHPTSFGDIGDKFYWDYTVDGGFTKTKIWDKATNYIKMPVRELLEFNLSAFGDSAEFHELNFIEIYGEEVEPELAPEISQAMADIWQHSESTLYMVRNNVKFKQLVAATVDEGVQLEDVTKAITSDLADTDLSELWLEHLGRTQ